MSRITSYNVCYTKLLRVEVIGGLMAGSLALLADAAHMLTDAMDGTLARVSGKVSRFGAFLDSTIDRFEESVVFLGLSRITSYNVCYTKLLRLKVGACFSWAAGL